ncbi:MAG: PAS domain S-box protein [Ignavibacteriaceae bacterium]|nr:PAS domain S-box protein [Ignavibacteriaceae bacterium]
MLSNPSEEEKQFEKITAAALLGTMPVGILVFDDQYNVTYLNSCFSNFGVLQPQFLVNPIGKNLKDEQLFLSGDISKDIQSLRDQFFFEKELGNQKTSDGGEISIILKGVALLEGETFLGGMLVVEDLRIIGDARNTNLPIQNENYSDIFQNLNNLLILTDIDGNVSYAFGNLLKTLFRKNLPNGKAGKNFLHHPIHEIFPTESLDKLEKLLKEIKETKKKSSFITSLRFEEEELVFDIQIFPVLTSRKEVQFVCFYFEDITVYIKEQEYLKQQIDELQFYEMITQKATDAMLVLNASGQIVFWNKTAENLTGYSKSEVYNKPFEKFFLSFDHNRLVSIFSYLADTEKYNANVSILTKQKQKKEIELSFFTAKNRESSQLYVVLCVDITEKIEVERVLRLSEERFRSIVDNATDLICNFSDTGKIIYANPSFLNELGFSEQEVSEKKLPDLLDAASSQQKKFSIKQVVQGKIKSAELTFVKKGGEFIEVLGNFSIAHDAQKKIKYIGGIFSDITAKKAFQQELLLMRAIFEASNDGIAVESNDAFVIVNNSFAKIFGYEKGEELLNTNPLSIVDETDLPRIKKYTEARTLREPAPNHYEFLSRQKDGTQNFVEVSVTSFEFKDDIFFVIIARDVTERKRVQQAIKESEERYRTITENLDDSLWTAERSGKGIRFTFFTSSIEKITGYSQSEFLHDAKYFFKITFPDDFKMIKEKLRKFVNNYYKNSEELVFRIIHKQGHLVWIKIKITVTRNQRGVILKMFGLVSDISLQKKAEAEVQKSSDNLKKLNDTKDRFISIVSHDLRTPFSSILGFTDILLNDDEITAEESRQYIGYIQESAQSMLALVNSLLDWTRLQTGRIRFEPAKIDLFEQIKKAMDTLSGFAIKKGITLQNMVKDEVNVFADKSLLAQVFNNLISNSLKFTRSGGTISINFAQSDVPRFIEVWVNDTGTGISKENLSKVFDVDAKFTSEGTAGEKGTGLGLSLVHEIIEKHGGKIWVESKVGKGTTFKFTLPKASATILLVDDSKTDRLLYSKILKSFVPDYEILLAGNGEEAWQIIEETSLALIITDHTMPKMNGIELVKNLRSSVIKGKPQIIILSGDIGKPETLAYNDLGVEYVFQKPVNLTQFKEAIEKSLRKIFN